jgi:hypothetical protein
MKSCVCHSRSLSAVRLLAFGNEPSNRLSAARRRRSLLRRPTPQTTSEAHAWLTELEQQQALAQSHLPAFSGARIRATSLSWRSAKR